MSDNNSTLRAFLQPRSVAVISPRQAFVDSVDGIEGVIDSFEEAVSVNVLCRDLLHKSDIGGVELDIRSSEEIIRAATRIEKAVTEQGYNIDGFVVQDTEIKLNPVICLPEPGSCFAVDAVIRTRSLD